VNPGGWSFPRGSGAWWLALLWLYLVSPLFAYLLHLGPAKAGRDSVVVWNVAISLLWLATLQAGFRRPFWLHLLLAPFYLTATADLFLVFRLGARLTSSYVDIVISDFGDAGEFIRAYRRDVLLALGVLVPLYALGLRGIRAVEVRVPSTLRWISLAMLLLVYGGAVARQMNAGLQLSRAALDVISHDHSSPLGAISQVAVTLALRAATREHLEARQAFSFGASRSRVVEGEEIYVLVIGESARPDHMSLDGYERNLTPNLRKQENLVAFEDVISTGPHTAVAVPSMLSLGSVTDWASIESQRSIVSAFREAGFRTYWVSAQEVSQWGGITYQVAGEAARRRYFERSLDVALVDELRRILDESLEPRKIFVAVHTRGSHFEYKNRYPPEFRRYPDAGGSARDDLVNSYDNSILYTDWILSRIIDVVRARQGRAFVLYASDHGENLLDDGDQLLGHAIGNSYDLPVASFLWYSDRMAAEEAGKIRAARSRTRVGISLANLSHSVLDLAGIEARGLDRSKSVFAGEFQPAPRFVRVRGRVQEYQGGPPPRHPPR